MYWDVEFLFRFLNSLTNSTQCIMQFLFFFFSFVGFWSLCLFFFPILHSGLKILLFFYPSVKESAYGSKTCLFIITFVEYLKCTIHLTLGISFKLCWLWWKVYHKSFYHAAPSFPFFPLFLFKSLLILGIVRWVCLLVWCFYTCAWVCIFICKCHLST